MVVVINSGPVSPAEPRTLKYLLEPPVYPEVAGRRGENVTLPCILKTKPSQYRVKWTKLQPETIGTENIIMISNAQAFKPYGRLGPRAALRKAHSMDASLQLSSLQLEDGGTYRCELVNGIEDESVSVVLRIEGKQDPVRDVRGDRTIKTGMLLLPGVVFPYQSPSGRYKFNFHEAKVACVEQDAILASYDQLFRGETLSHFKKG